MLKCGKHRGRTYEEVAALDRGYCAWVLNDGASSLAFRGFASFLRRAHGGVLKVGRHKGLFFDEAWERTGVLLLGRLPGVARGADESIRCFCSREGRRRGGGGFGGGRRGRHQPTLQAPLTRGDVNVAAVRARPGAWNFHVADGLLPLQTRQRRAERCAGGTSNPNPNPTLNPNSNPNPAPTPDSNPNPNPNQASRPAPPAPCPSRRSAWPRKPGWVKSVQPAAGCRK